MAILVNLGDGPAGGPPTLREVADEYERVLGEGPPLMQVPGTEAEQIAALRRAIDRGSPLRSDELFWPPPGADI